jgi:hypothetical protein
MRRATFIDQTLMGSLKALQLIFQAQFATLEIDDFPIVCGGRGENRFELFFKSTMLLLKRCDMSLDGHLARSFLGHPPQPSSQPRLQVCEGSVTRSPTFVEGEIVVSRRQNRDRA